MAARNLEGLQQLLVVPVCNSIKETVLLEDVLADGCATRTGVQPLAVAVGRLLKGLDEPAVVVRLDELVELASPDQLDHIEASAAESSLEFLNDLAVAPDRSVQTLIVAIDDHDHVVQPLAAGHRDRGNALGLVHFSVADEGPHTALGGVPQASEVQVAEEARLVHGAQRTETHGDSGVLPEIRHQPGVRVAGNALALGLATEVHDFLDRQAALDQGPGVHAGSGMALVPHAVAHAVPVVLASEEVVHANFKDVADGREGADVPTNTATTAIRVGDHDRGVPPDDVRDFVLDLTVTWVDGLRDGRDGVDHGGDHVALPEQ
mmetsp:Transcript_50947/g.163495  ORF Transcript_50947/g.163495 Transcript_50947/m.163495 type:complete len:320 (-) Transcript_50947:524-1483(-)